MRTVLRTIREDGGFSATWTAITAFLLVGMAALAVDVSGFYREAAFEQSAADMTCLAGVRDLPQSPSNALDHAVAIAKQNWPEMSAVSASIVAQTATLDDGNGNVVTMVAGYGGDLTKMAVTLTQQAPTQFGKVLGATSAQVTQEAYCKVQGLKLGDLPFGALPGGFQGILQVENPCDTGNCRPLELPRADWAGQGEWFIRNVAIGAEAQLDPNKWETDPLNMTTCAVGSGPCTIVNQDQGVSSGQLSDGLVRGSVTAGVSGRLADTSVATRTFVSLGGRTLDGDYPPQMLQVNPDPGVPMAFASFTGVTDPGALSAMAPPDKFDAEVHADATVPQSWVDVDKTHHIYYNDTIGKCDSPRFARIPIVAQIDWQPGEVVNLPGGNSDPVKVVGFYTVALEHPIVPGDFKNPSDALKTLSAEAVWFGDNANCIGPGGTVKPYEEGDAKVLRLVDQNA